MRDADDKLVNPRGCKGHLGDITRIYGYRGDILEMSLVHFLEDPKSFE